MGSAGDPRRDNYYLCDYHGCGWLLENFPLCQLMVIHPFPIAAAAKAVATIRKIVEYR